MFNNERVRNIISILCESVATVRNVGRNWLELKSCKMLKRTRSTIYFNITWPWLIITVARSYLSKKILVIKLSNI